MKNFLEFIGEEVSKAKKSLKIASTWIDQCILGKTQAIFRLITQNDINAVSQFFEYASEDQLRLLPNLKLGHLFLSGIAIPFTMLVEIEL